MNEVYPFGLASFMLSATRDSNPIMTLQMLKETKGAFSTSSVKSNQKCNSPNSYSLRYYGNKCIFIKYYFAENVSASSKNDTIKLENDNAVF